MSFIETSVTVVFALALAFTIYYQIIIRVLHIELKAREIHSILTPDGWRIRLFRYRKGGSSGEPVLLVHGYTANHWNLTLPHGESLADFLAQKGLDCWAIDLRGNRTSLPPPGTPRHRATYDGYVMQDLPAAIAFIRRSTGYDQVHWVGHSMGGMLLYAYELAHGREQIASGSTMASPPWLEAFWTRTQDRLVWFMETLPWVFEILKRAIAPVFAWRKPHHALVPVQWENLNPNFGIPEFFNAAEQSSGPVTRTFEECAKHRYLAVDNDRINVLQGLSRLQTPLLVLACPLDPIAPPANLRAFFDRLPSADKRFVELSKAEGCARDYSHIDPPFARNAASEVFTPIADWIEAHPAARSRPRTEAPAPAALPVTPTIAETAPQLLAHEATTSGLEASSWGKALQSAASILSGLDEGPGAAAETAGNGAAQRRAPSKKFATRNGAPKKSSAKAKASTKAKRAVAQRAPKPAKPAPSPESPNKVRGGRTPKSHAGREGQDPPDPRATAPKTSPNASGVNGGKASPAKSPRRSTKAKATRKRSTKERG